MLLAMRIAHNETIWTDSDLIRPSTNVYEFHIYLYYKKCGLYT